jgi:hypothetical protein
MPPRLLLPATLAVGAAVGAVAGYLVGRGVEPSAAHFLFIPAVTLLGVVIGFVLGGRAARDAAAVQERADEARAARRAARSKPPE